MRNALKNKNSLYPGVAKNFRPLSLLLPTNQLFHKKKRHNTVPKLNELNIALVQEVSLCVAKFAVILRKEYNGTRIKVSKWILHQEFDKSAEYLTTSTNPINYNIKATSYLQSLYSVYDNLELYPQMSMVAFP